MKKEIKKIIHYKVVYSNRVDEYLNEGWELYGPPILSILSDGIVFQAVIKREEKNDR